MPEPEKTPNSLLGLLGLGCAAVVALAVIALLANLGGIRDAEWYREITAKVSSAKEEIDQLLELREALQEPYPSESIKTNWNRSQVDSERRTTLAVSLIEPEFELPPEEDQEARRGLALEIARWVVAHHSSIGDYDAVSISFVKQFGAGITLQNRERHDFDVEELTEAEPPAREPAAADAPSA